MVITLLIFAIIAFMYFEAAEVLKPLALAILLSFALVPISQAIRAAQASPGGRGRADGVRSCWAAWGRSATRSASSSTAWPTSCRVRGQHQSGQDPGDEADPGERDRSKVKSVVGDVSKQLNAVDPGTTPSRRSGSSTIPTSASRCRSWLGPYVEGMGSASSS